MWFEISPNKNERRWKPTNCARTFTHAGRVTMLGQLASALAHELSQPLGAILRNAEAAEIMLQAS